MEFVYSPDNEVTGNRLEHNFTGVTVIYSEAITLSDNYIAHMRKLTGLWGSRSRESYDIPHRRQTRSPHCAVGIAGNLPRCSPRNILHIKKQPLHLQTTLPTYFYGEKGWPI